LVVAGQHDGVANHPEVVPISLKLASQSGQLKGIPFSSPPAHESPVGVGWRGFICVSFSEVWMQILKKVNKM
jgi:hypothetical protein